MIYVSMIDIFFEAQKALTESLGAKAGSWVTAASFFGGILLIALIDKFIPQAKNPHEFRKVEEMGGGEKLCAQQAYADGCLYRGHNSHS